MVAPAYIDVAVAGPPVVMRSVEQGDGVFGHASELLRAEALIRRDLPPPLGTGLLALGSRQAPALERGHCSELPPFLYGFVYCVTICSSLFRTPCNPERPTTTPP